MSCKVFIKQSILVLLLTVANAAMAQEDVFRTGNEFGIGARAIGLGGAYAAVGDDYSAVYWNPAALAQIRRFEISTTMSHLIRENNARFIGIQTDDQLSITRLNEVGVAYPVPTYRGSLVFAFGFNRVKSFDANFAFNAFNPLPEDSVLQGWRELEQGSLNQWTLAGAIDVSPRLSLGLSLNLWSGKQEYQFTEKEADNLDIYTFDRYRLDNLYTRGFSGTNVTAGALLRVNRFVRLAATLSTPTTLTIDEEWSVSEETLYDDRTVESGDEDGAIQFKLRSPFRFGAGGSINLAGLLVSGQLEFIDWSQVRYESEPPVEDLSRAEANEQIVERYRAITRVRLGAELTLPAMAAQLRAGYYRDPSPFRGATREMDREYFSLGFGVLLDKQIKLDVAYVFGEWEEQNPGFNEFVTRIAEKITLNKIFATLSFRL